MLDLAVASPRLDGMALGVVHAILVGRHVAKAGVRRRPQPAGQHGYGFFMLLVY